eukprot:SAG31_NODE_217_length_19988_cov_53.300820_10_plen_133_part_00
MRGAGSPSNLPPGNAQLGLPAHRRPPPTEVHDSPNKHATNKVDCRAAALGFDCEETALEMADELFGTADGYDRSSRSDAASEAASSGCRSDTATPLDVLMADTDRATEIAMVATAAAVGRLKPASRVAAVMA